MRKLALVLLSVGSLLAGCVAYDVPVTQGGGYYDSRGAYNSGPYYYRDGRPYYRDGDRDRDGVPNRQDRRPDDARRY